jgi:hypothetical protein
LSAPKRCGVDTGDVASLLALELVASLAAHNRAPLPVILAAIAEAPPTREALVREAKSVGAAAAAIECCQACLDRSQRLPAALMLRWRMGPG